jgi:hypothetical protein
MKAPFRPAWYEDELRRLDALKEHPQGRTWKHPMDLVLAIGLVGVVACAALGVFS